jgi:hypothetical protein
MAVIGASFGQTRLVHVVGEECGENQEQLRDREATESRADTLTR